MTCVRAAYYCHTVVIFVGLASTRHRSVADILSQVLTSILFWEIHVSMISGFYDLLISACRNTNLQIIIENETKFVWKGIHNMIVYCESAKILSLTVG